jgi:hypothetical protein
MWRIQLRTLIKCSGSAVAIHDVETKSFLLRKSRSHLSRPPRSASVCDANLQSSRSGLFRPSTFLFGGAEDSDARDKRGHDDTFPESENEARGLVPRLTSAALGRLTWAEILWTRRRAIAILALPVTGAAAADAVHLINRQFTYCFNH